DRRRLREPADTPYRSPERRPHGRRDRPLPEPRPPRTPPVLAITAAALVDGIVPGAVDDRTLLVQGDRATAVGRRSEVRVPRGEAADLVVLDGDPLADIANTRRIHAVVARGSAPRSSGRPPRSTKRPRPPANPRTERS
ncbi:MAG TPA: hypothetical protein VGF17_15820, partial [Phytomonospora sp.]